MNRDDQIRQQCSDIDMRALDAEILLQAMSEKLYAMEGLDPKNLANANAVECFITCALRNVELLKEHNKHILALAKTERDIA